MDIYGNYMGFMDFGNVRYFDIREIASIYQEIKPLKLFSLPSDSTRRIDSVTLRAGDVDNAQKAKERMEQA